jgi:methylated-DNA-protein-cysteine methyltransferase-like protein
MSERVKKAVRAKTRTRRADKAKGAASSVSPGTRFEQAFEKIYRLVLRIPRGRVMTYGQIARLLEDRYSPRLVGWAMHATPKDERNIPWHRVINSRGGISTGRVILAEPDRQQLMLEAEGVVFDTGGHCDLSSYQWSPRQRAARAKLNALRENKRGARREAQAPVRAAGRTSGTIKKKSRTREK